MQHVILTGNKKFFWCLCVWLECDVLNLNLKKRSVHKECTETSSAPSIKNQHTINIIALHYYYSSSFNLLWWCTDLAVLLGHMRDVVFFLRVARLTLWAAPALDIWSLGDLSLHSSSVLLFISSPFLPIGALHLHQTPRGLVRDLKTHYSTIRCFSSKNATNVCKLNKCLTLKCSRSEPLCVKSLLQSGHLKTLIFCLAKWVSKWTLSNAFWVKTVRHITHL